MPFPYHILAPDLRRVVDEHVKSHSVPAEQSPCSVVTDWGDQAEPAAQDDIVIEGFIAHAPPPPRGARRRTSSPRPS